MTLYYILSFAALIASLPFAREQLCISGGSVIPLSLIAVSILQALLFKSAEHEQSDLQGLNYSREEIDRAALRLGMKYHALTKLIVIPPLCVFIVYFDSVWKGLASVGLYLLSYLPVRFLVRAFRKE